MLKHCYQFISFLVILFLLLNYIVWPLYVNHGYKLKRGDPLVGPHYKKTSYYNGTLLSDFNFHPFFEELQKKLAEDQTINFYKWCIYYNEETKIFYKAELICVYKIGLKKNKLKFNVNNFFFKDKRGTIHLSSDLITIRIVENSLIAANEIYNKKHSISQNKSNMTKVYSEDKKFLGYNINTGFIQYEFLITSDEE